MFTMYLFIGVSLAVLSTQLCLADTQKSADAQKKTDQEKAASKWLELVDKGMYDASWDHASIIMQNTISKKEWDKVLNATRKPMGTVTSRHLLDQRPATNPHGLPAGDYMVIFYQTNFSRKPDSKELLTLYLEGNEWKVLTYQRD